MVCPIWNGTNLKGQEVCADSFYTKSPGCNSALDRVLVESNLRPDYASYVTLNMAGVKGQIFGNPSARAEVNQRTRMLKTVDNTEPNYGLQNGAFLRSAGSCGINAYENAMAQEAQSARARVALTNYANAKANRG
jgi:hypothetical protein